MVQTVELEFVPEALATCKSVPDLNYLFDQTQNNMNWLFVRFHIRKRLAELAPLKYFDDYVHFILCGLKNAKRSEILPILEEAQKLHDAKLSGIDSQIYLELLLELENIYIKLRKPTEGLFVYESLVSKMDVPVVSAVLAQEIATKRIEMNQPHKAIEFLYWVLKFTSKTDDKIALITKLGGKIIFCDLNLKYVNKSKLVN